MPIYARRMLGTMAAHTPMQGLVVCLVALGAVVTPIVALAALWWWT